MPLTFAESSPTTVPLRAVSTADFEAWHATLDERALRWADTAGFTGAAGQVLTFPDASGKMSMAVFGVGGDAARRRQRFLLGSVRTKLPDGVYALSGIETPDEIEEAALGWLLAGYEFRRYARASSRSVRLVAPDQVNANRVEIIAAGEALTRDLINTPASDMGPKELEKAAIALSKKHDARCHVVGDADLLSAGFPMIHAVGRASNNRPRLIEMNWGTSGPSLTLVGKGVCFDTGGLNIKPGASMGLMKKDMGGAAAVLGLAHMIMALKLPLQLRVLIPAVENSIGGDAFRPQDILISRKGLSVEINNTDAEGRLVLADALALADEGAPDLIVSMATLTGAARVAVGPDIAPFFATESADANAIGGSGEKVRDPVWRLPYWDPYEEMIEPGIADLDNAPKGGMAGCITAALFLRRFVTETPRYMHFDIYGWQPKSAPARPVGGVGQGTRAILEALPELLKL